MSDLKKKKILWVVYDFNQAGSQRYVYEICKALNKEKFEIDFLKIAPVAHDRNWDTEYYYESTLELGCRIFLLDDLLKRYEQNGNGNNKILDKTKKVFNKLSSKTVLQHSDKVSIILKTFLAEYDHVDFSGLNVYLSLCSTNKLNPENGIIHILTARFQDKKDIYEYFNKDRYYHFVSGFSNDTLKFELAGFTNYRHTYYPLCFETKPYEVSIPEKKDKPYTIAVFTRLSSMKPLDPYFYAIKLLSERGVNAELRVYGAGDPEELGLIRQLSYLYIADKVFFPGHVESIPELLKTAGIDLLWFQSTNQLPAGYAALEIAMSALPQVFWDFADIGLKNPIGEVFPSFTSLTEFVEFSEKLLYSKDLRNKLGMEQRNYIQQHNSSKAHIHILEELFN